MKKLLSIMLALLIALSLTGCSGALNNENSTSSRYEFIGEINMSVDYTSYLGYTAEIKGKLKNTTNREFSYVSVTFAIYDQAGNQIETALDNMNYLQAGETWSFTATMLGWTDECPKSCKLVNVETW